MNSWSTKKIGNKFLQVRRQDWHNQALDIISLCRSLSTKTWLILTTYYWSPLEQFLPRLFLLLLLFFRFGLVLFSVVCRFVCFHVKLFVEGVFTFFRFATFTTEGVQLPSATLDIRKYTIKHFICLFFVLFIDETAKPLQSPRVRLLSSNLTSYPSKRALKKSW